MTEAIVKYKTNKKKEGKVQFICWVDKTTLKKIKELKKVYKCNNQGEVIDVLVEKQKRSKKTTWQKDIDKELAIIKKTLKTTINEKLTTVADYIDLLKADKSKKRFDKLLNRKSRPSQNKNKLIIDEDDEIDKLLR
jgi:hypothetical protein